MAVAAPGTVLVTGGCGFIGVNLGRHLRDLGWTIRAYDDLSTGLADDARAVGYEIVEGDVRDLEGLRKAAAGVDAVVHLAARTSVIASIEDPVADAEANVYGTLNALLAARDAAAGFVFASSTAPLGAAEPPAREDKAPRPLSPYGASKLAGEGLCSAFSGSYDLPTVALRFSNVYGPYSYHKGSVVATFLKRVMDGEPLIVYGDGEQTRDFVHVDDLCAGIVAALGSDLRGEVVQLGTGWETSVNRLVELVLGLFPDREIEVRHAPARPGEILRNYSDIAKARELLGFSPRIRLEDGLASTKTWFEETYRA